MILFYAYIVYSLQDIFSLTHVRLHSLRKRSLKKNFFEWFVSSPPIVDGRENDRVTQTGENNKKKERKKEEDCHCNKSFQWPYLYTICTSSVTKSAYMLSYRLSMKRCDCCWHHHFQTLESLQRSVWPRQLSEKLYTPSPRSIALFTYPPFSYMKFKKKKTKKQKND